MCACLYCSDDSESEGEEEGNGIGEMHVVDNNAYNKTFTLNSVLNDNP